MAGRRVGRAALSLIGIPQALSVPGAPPLANFLAHALIRVDTSSRQMAVALRPRRTTRLGGTRGALATLAPAAVPSSGALDIPGKYRLAVSASAADPTNPHQHSNRFSYSGPNGRTAQLGLATETAYDRFCFPASGGCSASVEAPPGSALARLLGATSEEARAGFDDAKNARLNIATHPPKSRETQP